MRNYNHYHSVFSKFLSLIFLLLISIFSILIISGEQSYRNKQELGLIYDLSKIKDSIFLYTDISTNLLPSNVASNLLMLNKEKKSFNSRESLSVESFDKLNSKELEFFINNFFINEAADIIKYNICNITNNDIQGSEECKIISTKLSEESLDALISSSQEEILTYRSKNSVYVFSKLKNYPIVIILSKSVKIKNIISYLELYTHSKLEIIGIFVLIMIVIFMMYESIIKPFVHFAAKAQSYLIGKTLDLNADIQYLKSKSRESFYFVCFFEKWSELLRNEEFHINELAQAKNSLSLANLRMEKIVSGKTDDFSSRMLDITNMSNDKIVLKFEVFDFKPFLEDIINQMMPILKENKNQTLKLINNNSKQVSIDKTRITQVIRELIEIASNSSSYNSSIVLKLQNTIITIKEGYSSDAISISIPTNQTENSTEVFLQDSSFKSNDIVSHLSKEIVELHQGKIWVETNVSDGPIYNLTIPTSQADNVISFNPGSINLNKVTPNILMVDDEEVCLNSMEMILYGSRYNLIKIKSAQFALKYLQEYKEMISVIIVDLMMPDMYGLNFIIEVKNDPKLCDIPIILQTSSSDEDELAKAIDSGIFSLIRKPYSKQIMVAELERAMLSDNIKRIA